MFEHAVVVFPGFATKCPRGLLSFVFARGDVSRAISCPRRRSSAAVSTSFLPGYCLFPFGLVYPLISSLGLPASHGFTVRFLYFFNCSSRCAFVGVKGRRRKNCNKKSHGIPELVKSCDARKMVLDFYQAIIFIERNGFAWVFLGITSDIKSQ